MVKRCILPLALVLMMIITNVPSSSALVQEDSRLMTTPDGPTWSDDVKITANTAPDLYPYIHVDEDTDNHVVWSRNGEYVYKKLDMVGRGILNEKVIFKSEPIVKANGFNGATVSMDSSENIHIIYKENDLSNGSVIYRTFKSDGSPLTSPIDVSSFSIEMGTGADLEVGGNDKAYIPFDHHSGGRKVLSMTRVDSKGYYKGIDVGDPSWTIEGSTLISDLKGNIRILANVWDGTDQGVWAMTYLADMQDIGLRNRLYYTGDYTFPPMPKLAVCPDNGLAVLRFDQAGSAGDLSLILLDNKNEPVNGTNEVLISQNAAGPGDIVCDSKGSVHIVFVDGQDGRLRYLKVNNLDNLNDPLKVTMKGQASTPRIELDRHDGIHVVWVDDRDGNEEIYYKFAFTKGLELKMEPEEQARLMLIYCEEIKSGNISIKNLGGSNETVLLNVTIDYRGFEDEGWGASLDEDEIELGAQGRYPLQIYIKGPTVVYGVNDFIEVTVTASLKDEPGINDTVTFRIFSMACCCGIKVDIPDNVRTTMVDDTTEFTVSIRTDGHHDGETVLLDVEGNEDWDFLLSTPELVMDETGYSTVTLSVTPPNYAMCDDVASFTVTGRFKDLPRVMDRATAYAIVGCSLSVTMDLEPEYQVVDPGETAYITMTVTNEGNLAGYTVFIMELISGTGDWVVQIDRPSIVLLPKGSGIVTASVQVPDDALAGSQLKLVFDVINEGRTVYDSGIAIIEVDRIHDLKIDIRPGSQTIQAGGIAKYGIDVINDGNGLETLTLPVEGLKDGWFIEYLMEGTTVYELSLNPGETISLEAELRTPIQEVAGVYHLNILPRTERGVLDPIPLRVTIEQFYLIEIETIATKQIGLLNGHVSYQFTIENHGNGLDTVSMVAVGLRDLEYQFLVNDTDAVNVVDIEPQESVFVVLVVDIPTDPDRASYRFDIVCNSTGGPSARRMLMLEIEMPDLEIGAIRYDPDGLKVGRPVTITLSVTNSGSSMVLGVPVSLYINDDYFKSKVIDALPVDTVKLVQFVWTPGSHGLYILKFEADPDNTILEVDEENNVMVDKVLIRKHGGGLLPGFEIVTSLIAIVIVGGAGLVRRRRSF